MLSTLLDLLFPKRCIGCKKFGDLLCSVCFSRISFATDTICPVCNRRAINGSTHPICQTRYTLDGLSSGVVYHGIVRKMVYQFKYSPYLSSLAEPMTELLYESMIQNETAYRKIRKSTTPLFVPIPLHAKRYRKRGYNHAKLLAERLGEKFGGEVMDCLLRVKETKPQFSLSREERYKNMKDAFGLKPKFQEKIKGKEIILIDDLATSCATLNACANILKRAGAKAVWAVTFARE